MSESAARKYFFLHVMKTGGATFRQHLVANFGQDQIYPHLEADLAKDLYRPSYDVDYLLALPPERREQVRAYMGHFPFAAIAMFGEPVTTLTILRDPVDRTLSWLKHSKRLHPPHEKLSLEQIYDDPFYQPKFIRNHQSKVFSLTADDSCFGGTINLMAEVEVDDERFRRACANLEQIDLLGLHERYDEFLGDLRDRYQWRIDDVQNWNVAFGPWPVPDAFRRRIAADNAADMAFYEFARDLYARRRGGGR